VARPSPGFGIKPIHAAQAVKAACLIELKAMKPGNISVHGAGHGMTLADFVASAEAIAAVIAKPGLCVGERILACIRKTRKAVNCNTNLGIVLLSAPLVAAAVEPQASGSLRFRLQKVLADLSVQDAKLAYEAIRLASPAGLGRAQRHDVQAVPQVTLLQAMREARTRDRIAYQYASGFEDIFGFGVVRVHQGLERWGSQKWAAVGTYLGFLGHFPDTHIVRKWKAETARKVMRKAAKLEKELLDSIKAEKLMPQLLDFDAELKRAGINPGTSADLTVASLLAVRLEKMLGKFSTTGRRVLADAGHNVWACPTFSS
jgi:triphosphoribosyl-dephospho-CoA synthase